LAASAAQSGVWSVEWSVERSGVHGRRSTQHAGHRHSRTHRPAQARHRQRRMRGGRTDRQAAGNGGWRLKGLGARATRGGDGGSAGRAAETLVDYMDAAGRRDSEPSSGAVAARPRVERAGSRCSWRTGQEQRTTRTRGAAAGRNGRQQQRGGVGAPWGVEAQAMACSRRAEPALVEGAERRGSE
jgi:hypothetical protein